MSDSLSSPFFFVLLFFCLFCFLALGSAEAQATCERARWPDRGGLAGGKVARWSPNCDQLRNRDRLPKLVERDSSSSSGFQQVLLLLFWIDDVLNLN